MEKLEYKKLLFKVAFCTMACDGDIDDREIGEINIMGNTASFFDGIDFAAELIQLVEDFQTKGTKVIGELFDELRSTKLNPIQELIVLEVALRIINADKKHDQNEIKFLHLLRAKLQLHDETIIDRFGELEILHTNRYSKNIVSRRHDIEFLQNVDLPDLKKLSDEIIRTSEITPGPE